VPTAKSLLGQRAEHIAASRLTQMGYRLWQTNFRSRYGEIDIIAWDGDCLAFVEVRSHYSREFGTPRESVAARKQTRLSLTAQVFLSDNNLHEANCRFDVVEVIFAKGSPPVVEVIKCAFDAPD
jgi:putative endonuclease